MDDAQIGLLFAGVIVGIGVRPFFRLCLWCFDYPRERQRKKEFLEDRLRDLEREVFGMHQNERRRHRRIYEHVR